MKLDLVTFKSKFEADITERLTVIAGPNGVGKSTLLKDLAIELSSRRSPAEVDPGLYLDGKRMRCKLVTPKSLESYSLPLGLQQQQLSHVGGLNFDSFRAEMEGSPPINISHDLLRRFKAIVTESDRSIYVNGDIDTRNDLYENYRMRLLVPSLDSMTSVFFHYHKQYAERKYAGQNPKSIFKAIGRPKWIEAQKVIDQLALPFKIDIPDINLNLPDINRYKLKLKSTGDFLQGDQISSGQRTALILYDMIIGAEEHDAFLFDDIDGFMHPDLLRRFIDVLCSNLGERKSCAIWACHSPLLAQLASNANYFYISKFREKPQKTNKASLVQILSGGVLVVAENLFTVFVEGSDASFYTGFYNALVNRKTISIRRPLRFVSPRSNSTGDDSSCDSVVDLVNVLSSHGFSDLFGGLIDGDTGYKGELKGIEKLNRYSKENYLFDPLNVYAWCLDNDLDTPRDLPRFSNVGLGMAHDFISALSKDQLQQIIDFFASKLKSNPLFDDALKTLIDEQRNVLVYRDKEIRYPRLFLDAKGKLLRAPFVQLNSKFNAKNLEQQFAKGAFQPPDLVALITKLAS